MATSGSCTDPYSGRTAFNGYLVVTRSTVSGTSAKWRWELRARNPQNRNQTYMLDQKPWTVYVEGQKFTGSHNLDFRGGQSYIVLGSGTTGYIAQGGGTPTINFSFTHGPAGIFGTAAASGSFVASALATKPPAPTPFATTPDRITANSMRYQFSSNGSGGSPIIRWEYQYSTKKDFSSGNSSVRTSSGTSTIDGLNPETTYYLRSRGVNALGAGPWSVVRSGKTLELTSPTLTVTPTLSGAGATVRLAPTTADEVEKYEVQYEYLEPAPIPSPATRTVSTKTTSMNVSGLAPGAKYRWRSRTHTKYSVSDWSSWRTVIQPKPSTSPGDYFDGSSQATDDQTFSWTGAVGASTSRANGVGVLGWALSDLVSSSLGTATIQRVTGGFAGTYAALLQEIAPPAAGRVFGIQNAAEFRIPAQPGTTYVASAMLMPARDQAASMLIAWLDADGDLLELLPLADPTALPADEWTRIVTAGIAPMDTAYALPLIALDSTIWSAGDSIRADAMMVTMGGEYAYFDGSFADDGTYTYSWTGTANRSTSIREDRIVEGPDPLVDPDCAPIPSAPAPPVIDNDCIDEVGIWRRYWVSVPATEIANWQEMIPTMVLTTGAFPARQVRIRVYPNPFSYTPDQLGGAEWCSEQIISYLPAGTVMTLDGIMQRAWAAVGGLEAQAADHLLYGTNGVPATWPTLSCGIAHLVSLDVPLDAPESNLDISMSLTARW